MTGSRRADSNDLTRAGALSLSRLRRNLATWFRKYGRDLPWRKYRDAYRVWISEIMLQQTTVVAVVPYYERFLAQFPTLHDLAAASEHDVLRLWEGLGYYSRARNLRAAAQRIVSEYGGVVPHDVDELMRLPGIGMYTAGAVASLAYDRPAPIVEANTLRVYSRLLAFRGDPHSTSGKHHIWEFAGQAVPRRGAGAFNQALMDLGALVCTPTEPNCGECPVRSSCQAFRDGLQREIPLPKRRPETTFVTQAMVAVCKDGRYLLRRSPQGERWAGLWEFLRVDLDLKNENDKANGENGTQRQRNKMPFAQHALSAAVRQRIERAVANLSGLTVDVDTGAFDFHHSVTRFRIRLICAVAKLRGGTASDGAELRWAAPRTFSRHALSMPARKFADRLAVRHRTV